MIRFADDKEPNNPDFDIEKVKKILEKLFSEHGLGSIKQNATLVDLVDITDRILFKENKKSLYLIIDRNPNNSLDITIEKVE
jgi:hypothetical protein